MLLYNWKYSVKIQLCLLAYPRNFQIKLIKFAIIAIINNEKVNL